MQLDLNLLTALDALLEEGSVGAAADRLHLTSPAMSRALGRIRHVMDDQILVRTGRTMTPTPRALAVREQVHALVQQAQLVLAPEPDLDLATLDRTFTVRWHDAVANAIGPGLLAAARAQAPGVRLRLLAEASTDTNDLRHGRLDLEISSTPPDLADVREEVIAHGRLAVAMRPSAADRAGVGVGGNAGDHTGAGAGAGAGAGPALTIEQYAAADHITISRRGQMRDPIDDLLAARGLRRRVIATVPTTVVALQFARHSDVMVVVPEAMVRPTIGEFGLRTLPLPFLADPIPVILAWHHRYDGDRAHQWLRELVRAELRSGCDSLPD